MDTIPNGHEAQAQGRAEGLNGHAVDPEGMITISASDLEDLLDLAAARQRLEDMDDDDWIPWDQVEAEAEKEATS